MINQFMEWTFQFPAMIGLTLYMTPILLAWVGVAALVSFAINKSPTLTAAGIVTAFIGWFVYAWSFAVL